MHALCIKPNFTYVFSHFQHIFVSGLQYLQMLIGFNKSSPLLFENKNYMGQKTL